MARSSKFPLWKTSSTSSLEPTARTIEMGKRARTMEEKLLDVRTTRESLSSLAALEEAKL